MTAPPPIVSPSDPPPAASTESPKDKLARLRRERADREAPIEDAKVLREIEKEELIAKYTRELGALGSEFVVIDTGILGDPIIVAKKAPPVAWEKWLQSKQTPTDRYDYVATAIAHPSLAEYTAFRQQRTAIDMSVSVSLQAINGLAAEVELGK